MDLYFPAKFDRKYFPVQKKLHRGFYLPILENGVEDRMFRDLLSGFEILRFWFGGLKNWILDGLQFLVLWILRWIGLF